jgi:hypothetical protein
VEVIRGGAYTVSQASAHTTRAARTHRGRRGTNLQAICFSMAPTIASETGASEGENRATTLPERSIRNFAKFQ